MRTNKLLLSGILLSCSFVSFSQETIADKDELRIKKQTSVTAFDSQIKDVPFAAIRVYARCSIVSWLWKDGKDDTGRAEDIAVTAIDDHYKNKDEIPPGHSSKTRIFVLLDTHAKDTAKRLREKYKFSSQDEANKILALLGQKDGEKQAVDAAVRLLSLPNESFPDITYLLMRLEQQGSPELNRLLGAILSSEQAGRIRLQTHHIEMLTGFFIRPEIPRELGRQFITLVLARSRNVSALSVLDQMAYYRTLQRLWPDITTKYPDMVAEAGTVHAFLNGQVNQSTREANERNERIRNSQDKLAATVAEAERADNGAEKYSLYRSAARMALKEKKFVYAADLMEKASDVDVSVKSTPKEKEFRKKLHDEFYGNVVTASLEGNEPNAANHSVKKINEAVSKAEGLGKISKYYVDMNDLEPARQSYDEAIKLISRAENSSAGIATLIRMLPATEKLDAVRISELGKQIAKSINAIPSLNVEDKPDTKNYLDYVTKIMSINYDLRPALTELVKINKNAAADITGRIEKREIRIIADYVLLTESIDTLQKQKKNLESAMLP